MIECQKFQSNQKERCKEDQPQSSQVIAQIQNLNLGEGSPLLQVNQPHPKNNNEPQIMEQPVKPRSTQQKWTPTNTAHVRQPKPMTQQQEVLFHHKLATQKKARIANSSMRQMARQKALNGYVTISPDLQQQFNRCQSWREVVQLHKRHQPLYDTTLINVFLKSYHSEAKRLHQKGMLMSSQLFMLELS